MSNKRGAVPSGVKPAVILTATLVAFALSLVPLTGSAAVVPAVTQPWPQQLAHPTLASCPQGETLVAPTSGWTDDLGVSHITYKAAPGLVSMIPPKGLIADKVTTALLADVGLPSPSTHSSTYQRSVRQVIGLSQSQSAPEFCRSGPSHAFGMLDATAVASSSGDTVVSGNWAGYATTESERGEPITDVFGAWTVPQHTGGGTPSAEGTWVGIGGNALQNEANPGLIQTGTEMETGEGYRSFIEFAGGSGCTSQFCGHYSSVNAIDPGDSVQGEVLWENSTTACFYFEDLSRSSGAWDTCGPVVTDYGIPYDPTSAEWIDEFPGGFPYYDNPHTVSWTAMLAGVYGQSLTSPFTTPWTAEVMTAGTDATSPISCANSTIISYPVNAATNSLGIGTSQIVTCYVPGWVSGP